MLSFATETLVWERWLENAEREPGADAIVHWVAGETPFRWSRAGLLDRACRYAAILAACGVKPGEVCATILRHHRDFYPLYMAIEACGAIPAVLAYPNARLHEEKFRQGLEGMARHSGLDWILTEKTLDPVVRPLLLLGGTPIKEILFPLEWHSSAELTGAAAPAVPHPASSCQSPCLLQHSSGTTGLQKAVVLSHRMVLDHVLRYGQSIGLRGSDRVCSWLPLYHDMGLIAAFHLPLAAGIPTVQLDPFEWVVAPQIMIEAMAGEGSTLAWMPNFAFNHMVDRVRDDELEGMRLDAMRMFINCSEPVRASSQRRFIDRFAPLGLTPHRMAACYAMAETTFAVTQTECGQPPTVLRADRVALTQGEYRPATDAAARECVSSGVPIGGCVVRVVDENRRELPDGRVGEIAIQSVSLFEGYRLNPAQTAKVVSAGWFYSGDYGFWHAGQCYVIGRKKDLIIVAGKNIFPEDVEDAVNSLAGILAGRVVAFAVDDEIAGTERIGIVAETKVEDRAGRVALVRSIVDAGMRVDVTIGAVYLAPPRWLIKSSSGKPSRAANRERVLRELRPATEAEGKIIS